MIGGTVATLDMDDAIVLDVIGQLAADAAIWTDRGHGLIRHDEIGIVRRGKRAGRTRLHAFAAGYARRLAHRIP